MKLNIERNYSAFLKIELEINIIYYMKFVDIHILILKYNSKYYLKII